MFNKKDMRKQIKQMWKDFQGEERKVAEEEIYAQLFTHPFWLETKVVATTMSMPIEINTKPIIERAWGEGKTVAVPLVDMKEKQMSFYKINSYHELVRGTMDILEPSPDCSELKLDAHTLCIVPGLAFSKEGYRLGFGGGFYDRFLADFAGKTIALAFYFQYNQVFPVDIYDIPVQTVITNAKHV